MLVLVVDTAGIKGGVLLAAVGEAENDPSQAKVLGFRELSSREFSTQLIAAVAELLNGRPYRLADVDLLAVVSGPGSFTGLRVGLSAIKALAEATSKPLVAVSRLAVMASAATEGELDDAPVVHAVLDAGRGEFYHGLYGERGWTRLQESLQTLDDMTASLAQVPGQLVASEASVLAALRSLLPREIQAVGPREALTLVMRSWRAGRVSDVITLDVNYLRASDAEILATLALHARQRNSTATQANSWLT